MKKFLMIASAGLISFITACNNSGEKSASADTTAASSSASVLRPVPRVIKILQPCMPSMTQFHQAM